MEFKIILTADRPTNGDLVLAAETPLSGVTFMEEVGRCLRKSIDHLVRTRHVTLGALATYEVTVPQSLAIESGLFVDSSELRIVVEHDILSHYIFYMASVSQKSTGRPCYPYMHGEATLCSCVDELQFLDDWANLGYPTRLAWDNGLIPGYYCNNSGNQNTGIGCGGCTCGRDPEHHHHHCTPPPPPPKHCDLCPDNQGHNRYPHQDDCACVTKPPHTNVRPGAQYRPGPLPPAHQHVPTGPQPTRTKTFAFMC